MAKLWIRVCKECHLTILRYIIPLYTYSMTENSFSCPNEGMNGKSCEKPM